MRDLIRSRGAAMAQRLVARQQLQAFLLRHGRIFPGIKRWGPVYYRWLGGQKFELPGIKPSCRTTQMPFSTPIGCRSTNRWKAQLRLTKRYRQLAAKGKPVQVVVTEVARELLAFMWAIGQVVTPANA
jgi:hypothetical protein